ncbi:MAG: hypothetical protein KDD27_27865 [Saprospiraceae bacterium]|nr:hypothetical protein [Saprospiraceae bacterium]
MILLLFLAAMLTTKNATLAIGGVIVLAKVWDKIRPVIIARSEEGAEYHFGISHSTKRKNMKPLTQEGIVDFEVEENTVYGLCNKPSEIKAEIGTITMEKAAELIGSLPKRKKEKIEKRKKPTN